MDTGATEVQLCLTAASQGPFFLGPARQQHDAAQKLM